MAGLMGTSPETVVAALGTRTASRTRQFFEHDARTGLVKAQDLKIDLYTSAKQPNAGFGVQSPAFSSFSWFRTAPGDATGFRTVRRTCIHCGEPAKPEHEFCGKCGKRV